MTTLTIPLRDDLLQDIDNFAQMEDKSREDIISQALAMYIREVKFEKTCAWGRSHAIKHGITEEMVNEEFRLYKEEQRRGNIRPASRPFSRI